MPTRKINTPEEVIKVWQEFVNRQQTDKFILNPNKEVVNEIAKGVIINESKKELKYCPCKISTGDIQKDFICPCNFKIQEPWKNKGECWCSLFIKENNKK